VIRSPWEGLKGLASKAGGDLGEKAALMSVEPKKFFTEPHYNGFPAVHVRLKADSVGDLEVLITEAWRCQAPKDLVGRFRRSE
jgi:hypothetical protein